MCTTRYFPNFVRNSRLFPTPFLSLLTLLIILIPTLPVAIGDTKLKANDFEATKTFAGVIQVEAEILELTTYLVEDSPFSSGGKVISLRGAAGNNGAGSGQFRGSEGDYIIVVNYMDENDGISNLRFEANGATVDSWALDQDLGFPGPNASILTARSLGAVHLNRGDTYSIHGDKNNNEETRVDFIQFIPVTGVYQAEDATFSPLFNVATHNAGFTGAGYIDAFRDGFIEWTVNASIADGDPLRTADHVLDFRYAFGADDSNTKRPLDIYVNGELAASNSPFKTTGVFSRWQNQTAVVRLNNGSNTIRAQTRGPGGAGIDNLMANIDYLSVTPVDYLNAKGSVTPGTFSSSSFSFAPEPDAYHPEVGDSGYFDSYYGRIDPAGNRDTLDKWLAENDFTDHPHLVHSADYINAFDLGFGRQMHCIDNGRASCYVENFLNPGKDNEKFAATVTMERMNLSDKSIVAFFVYDEEGKRMNQIGLDSEGPKSVPESCYSCHGGNSHFGAPQEGGQYLPWDIDLLKEWEGHGTLESQAESFRQLNRIAWSDADRTDKTEIETLIESWYGGPPFIGTVFDSSPFHEIEDQKIVPKDISKKDWFTDATGYLDLAVISERRDRYFRERSLYTNVYTQYCRSCHVAQSFDWKKAIEFNRDAYRQICDGRKSPIMPHAELTDDLFNNKIHTFTNGGSKTAFQILCSEEPLETTPDPEPPTTGEEPGKEIFINKMCTSCHSTGDILDGGTFGGNISCPGDVLTASLGGQTSLDLGTIPDNNTDLGNPRSPTSMNGITLTDDEVAEISTYLNSFESCR